MSDSFLRLIPIRPEYVPDATNRETAIKMLRGMVIRTANIQSEVFQGIHFVDAGSNFERVECPACAAELTTEWWQEAMEAAFEHQFTTLTVMLPCCGAVSSLNDLRYMWPQGFARYCLSAQNPGIQDLSTAQITELAKIIGCELRRVWSHI